MSCYPQYFTAEDILEFQREYDLYLDQCWEETHAALGFLPAAAEDQVDKD